MPKETSKSSETESKEDTQSKLARNKNKESDQRNELDALRVFIEKCRTSDYSISEIKDMLIKKGWSDKIITKIFEELNIHEEDLKTSKSEEEKYKDKFGDENTLSESEASEVSKKINDIVKEVNKVVVGQDNNVKDVLLCLMCDSHALLEGVPGLAKSLLVETLSKVINGTSFNRIQFLPDLLPSDILGGEIYEPKTSTFKVFKGPIFANFILADEINRAPPKTHAALMETMQEEKVNIGVEEFILDKPFLVLATENPLESEGTYALPDAIVDRFMFKIMLDYPPRECEKLIITNNATTDKNIQQRVNFVLTKQEIMDIQKKVKKVYLSDRIRDYIMDIIEATRGLKKDLASVQFVKYGGSPRASIYLGIGARAKALMEGRTYVLPEDVRFVVPNVLRHRIQLNYKGKAHDISTEKVIEEILKVVKSV